jgi:hypothetical protein
MRCQMYTLPLTSGPAPQDDAVLNHPAAPADFKLRVPKFSVKAGEVVAVVGRVGSGARGHQLCVAPCSL